MSIFDRFVPKGTGGQKGKPFSFGSASFSALNEAAAQAKEEHPDDSNLVDDFLWALKEASKARRKKALEGSLEPMKAEARFFLSKDRLSAYACVLPPENGGADMTSEEFREDIYYEGIVYGVLQEEIPRDFPLAYYRIFPIARGTPPQPGEDGKAVELFRRRSHMQLEVQNGSQVDFSQDVPLQPIRKGRVICTIRPAKAGTAGRSVTGEELPAPQAVSAFVPQGENIELARNGQALTAGVDGILYMKDGLFCIQEQQIIDGDADASLGEIHIEGNLYIGGNADGGAEVMASGDIVIGGKLGQARVTSGGTIRVQGGVFGTKDKTFLNAAGQVQAPALEFARIEAGASVITETISNSVIYCGGTVYAMTGRGQITGSHICAGESILCRRVGNLAGGQSKFSVGYPPHLPETRERMTAEAAQAQSTVERLWEPVTSLRKKGSRISDSEKVLLGRLLEQREIYLKRVEQLKTELRAVNQALDKKSRGKIRCEKLYPVLVVQIGRLTEEVTTVEENCDIHVEGNVISLT